MKVKLLALDLDETTLNRNGELTDITRQALEQVIAKGIILVAASGRSLIALPEEIRKFSGIRYGVVSNGAAVFEMGTEKCLQQLHICAKALEAVLSLWQQEPEVILEVGIDGQMYAPADYVANPAAFRRSDYVVEYVQRTRKPVSDMHRFFRTHIQEIESVDLICADITLRDRIAEKVRQIVPEVYVTSSVPQMVEIANKNAGKANGLRFLAQQEAIQPAEIMACGNADNDSEMLQFAGLGVAVANATPRCLAAADVVTAAHDADGVAKAIFQYIINA